MGGGEQVDLILTDPPYLINYYSNHRKKGDKFTTPILNDNNPPIIQTALNNMCGILKDKSAFYCFCNDKSVDWFKNVLNNHLKFKNLLIWLKNGRTGGDLKGAYAKTTELVLYYSKNRHLLNGGRDTDVLSFNRVTGKKQLHQNQKPLELLCFLVGKSSDVGGVVFDGFGGSGSTLIACEKLGRKCLMMELSPVYCDLVIERYNDYVGCVG